MFIVVFGVRISMLVTVYTKGGHNMKFPVLDAKATGERIKELRMACHLTVEKVAEFMGFESVQAVYKWQRGDSLPTLDNTYALAALFGTTVDDILRGSLELERDDEPSPFFILKNSYYLQLCCS